MEAGLEGNSLVESTRYLIVIFFQGGILCPNRPILNVMIPFWLEEGKKLSVLLGDSKKKS